jgi:Zn-dependent peptidase ImmA (M78 family)
LRKPDDCTLTDGQRAKVRAEAGRALREAGALGVFPTPVEQIMAVARVEEVKDNVLDESFLAKMRAEAGGLIKSALSKVLGLFQAKSGLVFIDHSLMKVRKTFVRLHESAHGFLPWQRTMYALVEDCQHALESDLAALFDREASVFASEVLFQIDTFIRDAESREFSIWTPVRMSKDYGSSIYAAVRQYVAKNGRACAVLVLRAFSEKIESAGDSHSGANMIQASHWEEASMNGEAIFERFARTRCRGDRGGRDTRGGCRAS